MLADELRFAILADVRSAIRIERIALESARSYWSSGYGFNWLIHNQSKTLKS